MKRDHIKAEFQHIFDYPLTLAVAAMGYGKTTSARDFLNDSASRYIWLTVDSDESSPQFIWDSLTSQLSKAEPEIGRQMRAFGFPVDAPQRDKVLHTIEDLDYAVAYNNVSFADVSENMWYGTAVRFITAREITNGTSSGMYSPDAKLTRGEFIVLMMRAYGIAPDTNPADNFADAGNTYYTNYLAAAKRLGISAGIGNNMFAPGKEINRQEMFTLLYNTLKAIGQLPQGDSGIVISDFTDLVQIDSWAMDAMTVLVKTGIVSGSNGVITPLSTTTRSEMAQVLYNLLGTTR